MADKNTWHGYQTKLLGGGLLMAALILIASLLSRSEHAPPQQKQIEIAIQPQATPLLQAAPEISAYTPASPPSSPPEKAITTIEITKIDSKPNSNRPVFTKQAAPASSEPPKTMAVTPTPPAQNNAQFSAPAKTNSIKPQPASTAAVAKNTIHPKQTTAQSTAALNKKSTQTSPYTVAERRLLNVPKQHYAIQLAGANSYKYLESFIKTNGLQAKASYFQTYNKGQVWYVLIYGDFKTRAQAQAAIKQLPQAVQAQNPWPRSYADIQAAIQRKLS